MKYMELNASPEIFLQMYEQNVCLNYGEKNLKSIIKIIIELNRKYLKSGTNPLEVCPYDQRL